MSAALSPLAVFWHCLILNVDFELKTLRKKAFYGTHVLLSIHPEVFNYKLKKIGENWKDNANTIIVNP